MFQNNFIRIGDCEISSSAIINNGSIVGKKFRRYLNGAFEDDAKTIVRDNVFIGYYCLIGNGSVIGKNSILDDKSIVESNILLGENNLIIYCSQLCCNVIVGNDCVIGGFIGERTKIGN